MDPSRQHERAQQASPPAPPETGDAEVDAALKQLHALPGEALDAHLRAGEYVHRVLQGRLSDVGGG